MISMKTFYGIAGVLMVIAFLGNLWNLINVWHFITIGAKIATIAGSLLFNILLAVLFLGMWKITPDLSTNATAPEIDKLLKEYSTKL